jgi:hypothetical protein
VILLVNSEYQKLNSKVLDFFHALVCESIFLDYSIVDGKRLMKWAFTVPVKLRSINWLH